MKDATQLYNVPYITLFHRLKGRTTCYNVQINNRKLITTEEKALLQHVKSLDNNGFSPTLPFVTKMANQLLRQQLPSRSVGKNWLRRWVARNNILMAKYLRKYDHQRAKCEDLEILGNWFKLLQSTITKYGIVVEDIYNFDETGFQIGVIITAKVLTQTKPSKSGFNRIKSGRPLVNQPGNRHWVTIIEGINTSDWALPP